MRRATAGKKKAIYAKAGVTEYWLLDPLARELTIFTLEGTNDDLGRVHAESDTAASGVLAGLTFPVSDLLPD